MLLLAISFPRRHANTEPLADSQVRLAQAEAKLASEVAANRSGPAKQNQLCSFPAKDSSNQLVQRGDGVTNRTSVSRPVSRPVGQPKAANYNAGGSLFGGEEELHGSAPTQSERMCCNCYGTITIGTHEIGFGQRKCVDCGADGIQTESSCAMVRTGRMVKTEGDCGEAVARNRNAE